MSDFPTIVPGEIVERYGGAFDVEERIPRTIDALAGVAGRDVLILDTPSDGIRARQLRARDGRVFAAPGPSVASPASADIVLGLWSTLDRPGSADERDALRAVRPGGRILALHEYGRDQMSELAASAGDTPAAVRASVPVERQEAPFLASRWKVKVIHCFWTFESLDEARSFAERFGGPGRTVAASLRRPRLSHNLALFHRVAPTAP